MRARIHGVAAFLVVALVLAACQGAGGTADDPRDRSRHPRPARPTVAAPGATHAHGSHPAGDMGGMDMGGMDMGGAGAGGAHAGHDASLPPLASRLAAATRPSAAPPPTCSTPPAPRSRRTHPRPRPGRRLRPERPHQARDPLPERRQPARRPRARPRASGGSRLPARRLGRSPPARRLYTVRPGEPAPAPGGDIFFWHPHHPSCGSFLVPAGGSPTPAVLHVWTAPAAVDPWIQPVRQAFGRS